MLFKLSHVDIRHFRNLAVKKCEINLSSGSGGGSGGGSGSGGTVLR